MRFDKFTLKAQEVVQASQQLAEKFGHQQIEPEHLVMAILDQREGVIPPLLGKIGADQNQLMFPAQVRDRPLSPPGPRQSWTRPLPRPSK